MGSSRRRLARGPRLNNAAPSVQLHYRAFIPVESGEVGLVALPPPARSNGSCSFPASRFPMWVALLGEGWVVFQGEVDQPHEAEVCDEAGGRISSPGRIPPSFTDEGPQPTFCPAVQPVEQLSDIRLPVIVPPTANDRVYHRDHVPQRHRRSSLRQVADLTLELGHRLFVRHGVERPAFSNMSTNPR